MHLAIETSCDETSLALFCSDTYEVPSKGFNEIYKAQLIRSQIDLHSQYGGVVPELASRLHLECIYDLYYRLLNEQNIRPEQLRSISVTQGPGLKGCLLVGFSFAQGLGAALKIPVYGINHLEGHLLSYLLSCGQDCGFPKICLLVSGGHSEIVLVNNYGSYVLLCETSDDAAGEAFDKVGTMLGLAYPGGRLVSNLASQVKESRFRFPIGVANKMDSFSFSGLKTAIKRIIDEQHLNGLLDHQMKCEIAFAAEESIVESLLVKLRYWLNKYKVKAAVLVGGVAANKVLRNKFEELCKDQAINCYIPDLEFCTDNAAMIGAVAIVNNKLGQSLPIGDFSSVVPRWGIGQSV